MRTLLSGYYGLGNLGDEALLAALVRGLGQRGASVRVLSGDPGATHALHGVPAYHRTLGLAPALGWAQVVVSGGGGLLQDATSGRSLSYYLGVLRLARLLRRRVIVYGQSIGPLSAAGAARVSRALRGVPLAVRDASSARWCAANGLEAEVVADPALLLGALAPGAGPDPTGPVLLVPRHGHPSLNDALAEAGRLLAREGLPLATLALHPAEDAGALGRLRAALPSAAPCRAATPEEALSRVASSRYVLAARLHALILAEVAGVGFSGLVYDPKVAGFLEAARAPAHTVPVNAAALAAEASAARPPEQRAAAALRARAATGLDWLAQHIGG